MKKIVLIMMLAAISVAVTAQNVNIPDVRFKSLLVANTAINTNNDSKIQLSEAIAFKGQLNVINKQITDLTGLGFC